MRANCLARITQRNLPHKQKCKRKPDEGSHGSRDQTNAGQDNKPHHKPELVVPFPLNHVHLWLVFAKSIISIYEVNNLLCVGLTYAFHVVCCVDISV